MMIYMHAKRAAKRIGRWLNRNLYKVAVIIGIYIAGYIIFSIIHNCL